MHDEPGPIPAAAPPAATDPIESMMAAGDLPARRPAKDLAAAALDAARAERGEAPPPAAQAPVRPAAAPASREWLLRGLLVLNLALIGGVVALPIGNPSGKSEAAPAGETAHPPAPAGAPEPGFAVGTQGLYLRALEVAAEGKFDEAIAVLQQHLAANPNLGEVEQRLVYHALAMFAVRAGRSDEATRYEAAMDRLRIGAQLPQDLLDLARRAEAEGRGADMRRYYARFLLQQRQVPPSLRDRIAEAYLKLGDGYRLEAERGAEAEAAQRRAAEAVPKPAPAVDHPTPPAGGKR